MRDVEARSSRMCRLLGGENVGKVTIAALSSLHTCVHSDGLRRKRSGNICTEKLPVGMGTRTATADKGPVRKSKPKPLSIDNAFCLAATHATKPTPLGDDEDDLQQEGSGPDDL
ncbi:hypothetical protein SPRG_15417 [Saprolegnia parasitica CBS 223.65]|uniref:Uncharacterized protein n=1 Tax=Saprolegnia parasitica (strain CBS 223.65) TaxID=695850 RepID=A0A067BXW9_SAPPC|nr:hypothetical protein SPRG_15417 [Saprolegnia parasitica CBS 223.65]KDO19427.1 hypothetical protein SPRG_15417 [Saprolegnia parasitica CBS 223.65]|eukprot:XP_012209853.1 hypothetical protein SPRG_15417 [Saprolegnia parasitica CBS 223.65]